MSMRIVHLMASPFFGGPERQVLGLARHLPVDVQSIFLSFAERGLAQAFLGEASKHGFECKALVHNTPRLFACIKEVAGELQRLRADLVCCSGYKPDIVGWRAARRAGIPVVSISHGWTAATWKVRCYESLDRWVLRKMDAVVCVSRAQAAKVRRAKVPEDRIVTIRNAIGAEAFVEPNLEHRVEMARWFSTPPRWLIGAAGRLSPEKGFSVFLGAAAIVARQRPEAGFVLFGDGPLRAVLEKDIAERGLQGRFVLAGFRSDVMSFLPNLDLAVMSSYTEGLPVILLETGAAGVATVATAVGGIPEVVDNAHTGFLVAPGDAAALAQRIVTLLDDELMRQKMGQAARQRIRREFSFSAMAQDYHDLFRRVIVNTKLSGR